LGVSSEWNLPEALDIDHEIAKQWHDGCSWIFHVDVLIHFRSEKLPLCSLIDVYHCRVVVPPALHVKHPEQSTYLWNLLKISSAGGWLRVAMKEVVQT
jgi:hypothetical protein